MDASVLVESWKLRRHQAFEWRHELSVAKKLVLAMGLACFTGLCAQIRIPLPFTPVPITGQVFAVLLSGALMGRSYGAVSQFFYVGLGAAGMPWFAGGSGGLPGLLGFTGGYLIGFIPAAALVGWFTDRHIHLRNIFGQALLMMSAVAVIYLFGAVQFAIVMRSGLWSTLTGAVLPFIPVDLAKALAVAAVTATLLPKAPYGGEVDTAMYRRPAQALLPAPGELEYLGVGLLLEGRLQGVDSVDKRHRGH